MRAIPPTEHLGDTGKAFWRTLQLGDLRVQLVEYTPGYVANHWCARGHILLVQVADDDGEHRSSTQTGAKLFIVD